MRPYSTKGFSHMVLHFFSHFLVTYFWDGALTSFGMLLEQSYEASFSFEGGVVLTR